MKRIKHNDLLPYFIMDERSLAKRRAYVRSCEKFFKSIKQQAQSNKRQASSSKRLTGPGSYGINRIIKEK